MGKEKLYIFDTTLRDGEQSPGVTLSVADKVEIAKHLCRLGVDILEAGFPIASPGDFEAVQQISMQVGPYLPPNRKEHMTICGLARAVKKDIDRAYDAVKHAPKHRIHTFLATSDLHLQYKLKITREQCVQKAVEAVQYAKSLADDVEFSPEDAGRSDRDFLCKVLGSVIEAGATTLNIPDTVGYNTPEEYGEMISYLRKNTVGGDQVIWSTHCHNDLGLATANTLSGIANGARQVEVTINGIGERAGNTSLEEIVMAIYTHQKKFPVYTDIETKELYRLSQLVSQKTGMLVQPNKAIVGANAFAHSSGIHQDGLIKCQETYEIIHPSVVGVPSSQLVMTKHSGRNALKTRLSQLGFDAYIEDQEALDKIFEKFKRAADAKRNGSLTDSDLVALVANESTSIGDVYQVDYVQVVSSASALDEDQYSPDRPSATATIVLRDLSSGELVLKTDSAVGKGPVEAVINCINRIVGHDSDAILFEYEVKSVTEGSDALGNVVVKVQYKDKLYIGRSTHWDVIVASANAYVRALNQF
jgi:2-isopropylmalate synthase